MTAPLFNNQPVLKCSAHFPLNGAWSAELQISSDVIPNVGDVATLTLPGPVDYLGRVERAGIFGERLRVRLTGGESEWSRPIDVRHYRNSDGDQAMRDLGIQTEAPLELDLAYWTRPAGTIGAAVQSLADLAKVNWRVLANGTTRIREEDPFPVEPDAVEISRDDARGIVEVAPEFCVIQPGTTFNGDTIGDVVYEQDDQSFRCRYWTEQRAVLRGALERLVRWVTRDSIYQGQYACQVIAQGADGSLDLMPDDIRLRAQGLQAVPIRHGLPGCRVQVAPGEVVLLGFENGDPRLPYAALWREGQVLSVEIGGTLPVAMAAAVDAAFAAHLAVFNAHTHPVPGVTVGPGATVTTPTATPFTPAQPTASLILKSS
jgi:hypothetical protein